MTPEDRERKRCALARDLYGPGSPCTDDPVIDAMVCAKETIKELRAKLAAMGDLDAAGTEHGVPSASPTPAEEHAVTCAPRTCRCGGTLLRGSKPGYGVFFDQCMKCGERTLKDSFDITRDP
jgi:hypothetical protein